MEVYSHKLSGNAHLLPHFTVVHGFCHGVQKTPFFGPKPILQRSNGQSMTNIPSLEKFEKYNTVLFCLSYAEPTCPAPFEKNAVTQVLDNQLKYREKFPSGAVVFAKCMLANFTLPSTHRVLRCSVNEMWDPEPIPCKPIPKSKTFLKVAFFIYSILSEFYHRIQMPFCFDSVF